eukprot:TRINITY_DN22801_c0_g1_i2.p1 TRINITY_DN22801_c0_g1~~TRINITY_DN22801_c0_g1_i2.p1  ORF type:complete len:965 (+),score=264.31 TRINITY_DN22801_c0_g1_i2:125-3019(+)
MPAGTSDAPAAAASEASTSPKTKAKAKAKKDALNLKDWPPKEFPTCSVILISLCLFAHILVLYGNLQVSAAFTAAGDSAVGWASVGSGLATSLRTELAEKMIADTTEDLEQAMSQSGIMGGAMDQALVDLANAAETNKGAGAGAAMSAVATVGMETVDKLSGVFKENQGKMIEHLKPTVQLLSRVNPRALRSIGTIGKSVEMLQDFAGDIIVQAGLRPKPGKGRDEVIEKSLSLYDINGDGTVTRTELKEAAKKYQVKNLQGESATVAAAFKKHAKGEGLDKAGFKKFMQDIDPTMIKVTGVALRMYAKKLRTTAESLQDADLRKRHAELQADILVMITRIDKKLFGQVAEKLAGKNSEKTGAVPIELPADVLAALCMKVRSGKDSKELIQGTGKQLLGAMLKADDPRTRESVDKVSNITFWTEEGFPEAEQPECLRMVTEWMTSAVASSSSRSSSLLSEADGDMMGGQTTSRSEMLAALAQRLAQESVNLFTVERIKSRARQLWPTTVSPTLRVVLDECQQGEFITDSPGGVVKAIKATNETRAMSRWLSEQEVKAASKLSDLVDVFSGQTDFDNLADDVVESSQKMSSFFESMEVFASKDGIAHVEDIFKRFSRRGVEEVIEVIGEELNESSAAEDSKPSLLETAVLQLPRESPEVDQLGKDLETAVQSSPAAAVLKTTPAPSAKASGANPNSWRNMAALMRALHKNVPTAVELLEQVRVQARAASKELEVASEQIKESVAPAALGGKAWKAVGIALFVFWLPPYLGLLYYAFWGGGYFGGPQPIDDAEYEPPSTFRERMSACWRCCCNWCTSWNDTQTCMISTVVLMQLMILVMFLLANAVGILCALFIILGSLCSALPIVSSASDCSAIINGITTLFPAFYVSNPGEDMSGACGAYSLVTCDVMAPRLKTGALLCIAGSWLAIILTSELIIQFAAMHECVKYRRIAKVFQAEASKAQAIL